MKTISFAFHFTDSFTGCDGVVLIGVAALVQIPVELLKETVIMMMIVKVISYAALKTVSLHSHHMQTAAMTHFQVSKEFLQSLQKNDV